MTLVQRVGSWRFGLEQNAAVELDPLRIIDVRQPANRSQRLTFEFTVGRSRRRCPASRLRCVQRATALVDVLQPMVVLPQELGEPDAVAAPSAGP